MTNTVVLVLGPLSEVVAGELAEDAVLVLGTVAVLVGTTLELGKGVLEEEEGEPVIVKFGDVLPESPNTIIR